MEGMLEKMENLDLISNLNIADSGKIYLYRCPHCLVHFDVGEAQHKGEAAILCVWCGKESRQSIYIQEGSLWPYQ
jgi:hypothetical protein